MGRIPEISRGDVEQAIENLLPNLAELQTGPHQSTKYDLLFGGHRLPPKAVIAEAVRIATGKSFDESDFSGGKDSGHANDVLKTLGFAIVTKSNRAGALNGLVLLERYSRSDGYAASHSAMDTPARCA